MFRLFSRYDVITYKCKQISESVLPDAFYDNLLTFLIFLNIQMGMIIIKDRRRAVYFNNQKTLIWPLTDTANGVKLFM